MDALTAHVDLRLATIARHPLFLGQGDARAQVLENLREVHAARGATLEVLEGDGGPLAVFCWAHRETSFFGIPVDQVLIDHKPGAPIRPWLDDILARELPRMTASIDAMVDAHYPEVIRAFLAAGLGLDSVQLIGSPEKALLRLRRSPAAGLELRPLRADDIDRTVEFERALFRCEPQWCFFGANDAFVEKRREALLSSLTDPLSVERSIVVDGRFVGHASASVRENRLFGRVAGMAFALGEGARGRGLARPMYRHLLEAAEERGARVFRGGTSQPPVLRLGHEMGRSALAWLIRRDVPFAPSHFGAYAAGL